MITVSRPRTAPSSTASASWRRWVGRCLAVGYVLSVAAAVMVLAMGGDLFLAVWLAALEVASVIVIFFVTRGGGASSGPPRTTRLGRPTDPGMPSGRR